MNSGKYLGGIQQQEENLGSFEDFPTELSKETFLRKVVQAVQQATRRERGFQYVQFLLENGATTVWSGFSDGIEEEIRLLKITL